MTDSNLQAHVLILQGFTAMGAGGRRRGRDSHLQLCLGPMREDGGRVTFLTEG